MSETTEITLLYRGGGNQVSWSTAARLSHDGFLFDKGGEALVVRTQAAARHDHRACSEWLDAATPIFPITGDDGI